MTQTGLFLLAMYGVSWTLWFLLRPAAAQGQVWAVLGWLFPVVWSPTVVALILTLFGKGVTGVKQELRIRLSYRPGSGRWYMLAGVTPVLATAAAVVIARWAGDGAPFVASAVLPMILVMQVMTGAVGEELGWRAFLLPRLERRFGDLTAAWVMGLLWALWHLPAFSFPGMPHQAMPLVSNLVFTALFGVFLAFVFSRAGGSVLATILAHLVMNITLAIGGVVLSSVVFWRAMVGIYAAVALFFVGRSYRRALSAAQQGAAADAARSM